MPRYQSLFDNAGNEMTFTEVLELCRRSYDDLSQSSSVQIAGTTMSVEGHRITGGFAAFVIQKPRAWRALVYRGSNDTRDWVFNNIPGALSGLISIPPPQYRTGRTYASEQTRQTVLVGHSLGGGIAMYSAAQEGMVAATIFPAPIQPTWLGLPPWPARGTRIQNYVSSGEILSMAVYAPTTHMRFGTDVWIQTKSGSPIDKHLLPNVIE